MDYQQFYYHHQSPPLAAQVEVYARALLHHYLTATELRDRIFEITRPAFEAGHFDDPQTAWHGNYEGFPGVRQITRDLAWEILQKTSQNPLRRKDVERKDVEPTPPKTPSLVDRWIERSRRFDFQDRQILIMKMIWDTSYAVIASTLNMRRSEVRSRFGEIKRRLDEEFGTLACKTPAL